MLIVYFPILDAEEENEVQESKKVCSSITTKSTIMIEEDFTLL